MNQVFMSEMVEIVDSLEIRLPKLFSKIDRLEESSNHLKQELAKAAGIIQKQSQQIEALQKQYDTLKIANSLLGSDENKRDTKLKINSLIREIDYCIAQLSD
jgi:chromosome segregation ATPase